MAAGMGIGAGTGARATLGLAGAAAGASLYGLGRLIEREVLTEIPALAAIAFLAVFFSTLLALTGPVTMRRAAAAGLGLGLLVAALLSLAALRFPLIEGLASEPIPAVSALILSAIPLPFVIAQARGNWRAYPVLFGESWGIVVRMTVAWLFTGLVWGVIFLSDALFRIVGLDLISDLLEVDIVPFLITGGVLGLALAVAMELSDYISPYLLLRLLRLLLPLVLVVLVVFIGGLPFQGLSGLFGGLSVAATLLVMAAVAATLVTSAVDQQDDSATDMALMQRAAQALALVLGVPVVLAAWSIWLRVDQYGWSPDRLFAATAAAIGLGYGGLYGLSVLRGRGWMARIRAANTWMALALIAAALLWLSVLNPQAISTSSQMARLEDGRTPVARFDIAALRQWGIPGEAALAELEARAEAGDTSLAERLAAGDYPDAPTTDAAPLRERLAKSLPVRPETATDLRDRVIAAADPWLLDRWDRVCATPLSPATPACVMIVADLLPDQQGDEILLALAEDGYVSLEGFFLRDGVLQSRSVQGTTGFLPDMTDPVALMTALQAPAPALAPFTLNALRLPGFEEGVFLLP